MKTATIVYLASSLLVTGISAMDQETKLETKGRKSPNFLKIAMKTQLEEAKTLLEEREKVRAFAAENRVALLKRLGNDPRLILSDVDQANDIGLFDNFSLRELTKILAQ